MQPSAGTQNGSQTCQICGPGNSSRKLVNNFIERLDRKTDLSDEDEEVIAQNLDRCLTSRNIRSLPLR